MEVQNQFEHLSTRNGFNKALGHFRSVSEIIDHMDEGRNLADVLNYLLDEKEVQQQQILPTVYALLHDKYGYSFHSHTMEKSLTDFSYILKELPRWKAVDVVLIYFHPDLGAQVINPKNEGHFASLNVLKENELFTIYCSGGSTQDADKKEQKALQTLVKLLNGAKVKTPDLLLKGKFKAKTVEFASEEEDVEEEEAEIEEETVEEGTAPEKAEKAEASETGKRRMTPFYSIPVTNELFHNGNVEAWKKVIQSYRAKHPGLDVYIYYDGERIHDIHSLFKWGKVKHGSTILVAVAGEDIQDVAKLQRYLRQGASPQFEAFLRYPVNTILNLF
ncbi:MAG: hypothetical protein R6V86_11375 [Spirochaetia bacterium]